jgi:molecular chaperone GrpE (heat shock protein)
MTAALGTREGGQMHATPLSMLLDLTGLELEARKNILQALKDSHAREMRLQAEVQNLREQLERERADHHRFGGRTKSDH